MTKVQLGKEKFDFSPDMDLNTFTSANEAYYYASYESSHEDEPNKLYKVMDWDTDDLREWVMSDKQAIIDLMGELYVEFLSTNYGG